MMHQTRLLTLILVLALGLSPRFISAQWFGDTVFGKQVEDCPDDCPLQHYTLTGDQCTDECATRGYDYYWCHTASDWGYCSPKQNTDYYGNACREDDACSDGGYDYNWCYLKKGSWDKCSQVKVSPKHQTTNMQNCIDACQYDQSGEYYWCHTATHWDYCSPEPDVTYKNSRCRSNHPCGNHGEKYRWCYTSYNDDWDYCGITSPEECTPYTDPSRWKRQIDEDKYVCKKQNNNGKDIFFKAEDSQNAIQQCSNNLREEALGLIEQWNNQRLGSQSRSNLITSENLRIDLQNVFPRGNVYYYNLQIQINQQRRPGQSTTVSQILVPVDTSAQDMREAFQYSLDRQQRIVLEIRDPQPSGSNNNNSRNKKCCKKRKH